MSRPPERREVTGPHEHEPASMCKQLEEFIELLEGAPPPATVMGFFAGISSARRSVPGTVWYPMMFDGCGLPSDVSKSLIVLATGAYDEVLEAMLHAPASCVPPAWTEERRQWCDGFVRGMFLCGEPPPDDLELATALLQMEVLGGASTLEDLYRDEPVKLPEDEWRKAMEEHLPELVFALCYEMLELAIREAPPPEALRPRSRNANCPCGSGKKYKRCCGAA